MKGIVYVNRSPEEVRARALRVMRHPRLPLELPDLAVMTRGQIGAVLGWANRHGLIIRRGRRWQITEQGEMFLRHEKAA